MQKHQIKENIVLVCRCDLIGEILKEYDEINSIEVFESYILFKIQERKYSLHMFDEDDFPIICIVDNDMSYPHFMLRAIEIEGSMHRSICLFEEESIIKYIHTFEEKIHLCIDSLIELIHLPYDKIVEEYQKEFLFYWKRACNVKSKYEKLKYQLYLDNPEKYQWFEQQIFSKDVIRISYTNKYFNDSKEKKAIDNIPALYLPLQDIRKLIPPIDKKEWGGKEICDILDNPSYQRIPTEAFNDIVNKSYSEKSIVLIFQLNALYFGCVVEFKNPGTAKLINKFETQIEKVIPIYVERCDFEFLNNQIGNEVHNEKICIVGCGSLGSYVTTELVRAGYKNITIIDGDKYEAPNTFRHSITVSHWGINKSILHAWQLKFIHPEINIETVDKFLTSENIEECKINEFDIIIFTVGNSDVQLKLNKALKKQNINKTIIYAWLEHDGKTSHIAVINGFSNGCFECIFTDDNGELCGNVVNVAPKNEIKYVRNGCGGTRVPYGNKTLLDATSMLLKALDELQGENVLYSYIDDCVIKKTFPSNERCNCCGVRK